MKYDFTIIIAHYFPNDISRINPILKTLGEHPNENKSITVHKGKFGPYVKCGKIMTSLTAEQTIDNLKLEEAIKLISERKIKIVNKTKKK